MNQVNILGRIATDLELRKTQSGTDCVKFIVAVDRYSGGKKSADFIRCVAWGKTADNIVKFFSKGSSIAISGNIKTGSFTDKNGTKHYTTDVYVSNFYFTSTKKEQTSNTKPANTYGGYSSDSGYNGYRNYPDYDHMKPYERYDGYEF